MEAGNPGKIFTLIPKIMAEVGHIGKDRQSKDGGVRYAFRGVDDVYFALQPLFAKHGVFCAPTILEMTREERQTKAGSAITYTILRVQFTFYADDGSHFTASSVGEAMDTSDKSSNKAMSAAFKYVMFQLFCIPVEGDNDTENTSHELSARPAAPSGFSQPAKRWTPPGGTAGAGHYPPPVQPRKPPVQPKAQPGPPGDFGEDISL